MSFIYFLYHIIGWQFIWERNKILGIAVPRDSHLNTEFRSENNIDPILADAITKTIIPDSVSIF